jgi:hypothetical protein
LVSWRIGTRRKKDGVKEHKIDDIFPRGHEMATFGFNDITTECRFERKRKKKMILSVRKKLNEPILAVLLGNLSVIHVRGRKKKVV